MNMCDATRVSLKNGNVLVVVCTINYRCLRLTYVYGEFLSSSRDLRIDYGLCDESEMELDYEYGHGGSFGVFLAFANIANIFRRRMHYLSAKNRKGKQRETNHHRWLRRDGIRVRPSTIEEGG